MKIIQYGTVTLLHDEVPRVEGWQIEREPEDPPNATNEQLLLGYAIKWAQDRFKAACNSAALDVFRENAKKKVEPPRCAVTNNLCGSGTWMIDRPCRCPNCHKYLTGSAN